MDKGDRHTIGRSKQETKYSTLLIIWKPPGKTIYRILHTANSQNVKEMITSSPGNSVVMLVYLYTARGIDIYIDIINIKNSAPKSP